MFLVDHIIVTLIQYCQKMEQNRQKKLGQNGVVYGQWSRAGELSDSDLEEVVE